MLTDQDNSQKLKVAYSNGDYQSVTKIALNCLRVDGTDANAHYYLGMVLIKLKKFNDALNSFSYAVKFKPSEVLFQTGYADTLLSLGKLHDADSVLRDARAACENDALALTLQYRAECVGIIKAGEPTTITLELLKKSLDEGILEQTLRNTTTLMSLCPKSLTALNMHSVALTKATKYDEAMATLHKAQSIDDTDFATLYNLGILKLEQSQFQTAIEYFERAVNLNQDSGSLYFNLGNALYYGKEFERAVFAYTKAITRGFVTADIFTNRGIALKSIGRLDEALLDFKRSINLDPEIAETQLNMATIYYEAGELLQALEILNIALPHVREDSNIQLLMGLIHTDLKQNKQAMVHLHGAIKSNPENETAGLELGRALYSIGDLIGAEKCFENIKTEYAKIEQLRCIYDLQEKARFSCLAQELINKNITNAFLGSLIARGNAHFGLDKENPFCSKPFDFIHHVNLSDQCNFNEKFVKPCLNLLRDGNVETKAQSLLKNGIQTSGNIFTQVGEHSKNWKMIIQSELSRYFEIHKNSGEGFIQFWPNNYELRGWLVSMESGGELSAHIHESSWVTGTIYINIPTDLKNEEGNLKLLEADETNGSKDFNLDVRTGSLCFFPASLMHRTIPFNSTEQRIVLAFDIIPV